MNVFISPHLDDIAYSCYGTLHDASFPCLCMVVFNKSCYAFNKVEPLKKEEISALRMKEEKEFCELSQTELLLLGYEDSSARSKLEIDDNLVRETIINHLLALGPSSLYAPVGIGWHYDHMIVRNIILSFWKQYHTSYSLYLYEDLPYICEFSNEDYKKELDKVAQENLVSFCPYLCEFDKYQSGWEYVIKNVYKSQYNEDEFMKMKKYRENQKTKVERIWKCIM